MRLHQWSKNLLLFLPMLAAHRLEPLLVLQSFGAFVVFGLAASSVYLLNDLLDLPDDRAHPHKRHRPIASGRITLPQAIVLAPALLLTALAGGWLLFPPTFFAVLTAYYAAALAYSLFLKRKVIVDVLTLGLLYTLRIVAGAAALALPLTAWMLAFSLCAFISLAIIKRYAELLASPDLHGESSLAGRGYRANDLPLLQSFGTASGYLSVVVLALYIRDPATAVLYGRPAIIGLAVPIWLYWISRAWLITDRGGMHDDPVLFALKDRTSYLIGLALAITFLAAT
jgi:4-hydroxybenzoate polyprenyltransferase